MQQKRAPGRAGILPQRLIVRRKTLRKLRGEIGRLKDMNTALGERVVTLENRADLRPASPPEDLKFVFILTYGRSGSTLLQGVLNTIPGFLIRGENGGALHHLQEFNRKMIQSREENGPGAVPADPWFGIGGYSEGSAFASIRRLALDVILRPQHDTRTTGYKEIRWVDPDVSSLGSLGSHVEFVRNVFPGARFVVNTRNVESVARSAWWSRQPDALERVSTLHEAVLQQANALGEDAYRVHYDDYIADPARLQGLFDWLTEPLDATKIGLVLGRRHSF